VIAKGVAWSGFDAKVLLGEGGGVLILPFLFVLAWGLYPHFVFNGLASQLYMTLAIGVLLTIFCNRAAFADTRVGGLYWALLVIILLSDMRSGEFGPALARDTVWLLLPIVVVWFSWLVRNPNFEVVFGFTLIGTVAYVLWSMIVEPPRFFWTLPVMRHVRHFGMTVGVWALLTYLMDDRMGRWSWLLRSFRLIALGFMIWSGTRASYVGYAVFLLACLVYQPSVRLFRTLLFDALAAGVLAVLFTFWWPVEGGFFASFHRTALSVASGSLDRVSSTRWSMWAGIWSALVDSGRLWAGFGGNGLIRMQDVYGAQLSSPPHIHPHNFFFQALSDWGLPGLLITCLVVAALLKWQWRAARASRRAGFAGATVLYLATVAMFDAALYHLEFLVYLAILLAVLRADAPPESGDRQAAWWQGPALNYRVLAVLIGASVLLHLKVLDYRIDLPWYYATR
jgi:O-antigen ligase